MATELPLDTVPIKFGEKPDRMDTKRWRRIKLQVLVGFGLFITLIIVMGTISVQKIDMLGNLTATIHGHQLEVSNAALRASMSVAKMRRGMRDVILAKGETARSEILNQLKSEETLVYENLDIVRDKILGPVGKDLEKKSRVLFEQWAPIREQVIMLVLADRADEAAHLTMGKGADHVENIQTSMLELTSYARAKADSFIANAYEIQKKAKRFMLIFTLAGILLSWGIAFLTLNRLYYALKRYRHTQEENERLIIELQQALSEVKKLSGFLPICASCKKIRDDRGYWNQIETYIRDHSEAQFSHSLCPECSRRLYPELTRLKPEDE